MRKSLRMRLRAAIISPAMLVSICIGVFLLLWNRVLNVIVYNASIGPLTFKEAGSIFLDDIYQANALGGFSLFAPIIAVLPATTLFCEDWSSGYLKPILCRIEKRRYIRETAICSSVAGGLAVFLPTLITDAFYIINGKLNTQENMAINYSTVFDETVYHRLQYLWDGFFLVLFFLLLAFLFGAAWSNAGLLISALIPNRYVALAAPFALYFSIHLIFYRIGFLLVLSPANILMPAAAYIPYASYPLIYQTVFLAIVTALFTVLSRRRLNDV